MTWKRSRYSRKCVFVRLNITLLWEKCYVIMSLWETITSLQEILLLVLPQEKTHYYYYETNWNVLCYCEKSLKKKRRYFVKMSGYCEKYIVLLRETSARSYYEKKSHVIMRNTPSKDREYIVLLREKHRVLLTRKSHDIIARKILHYYGKRLRNFTLGENITLLWQTHFIIMGKTLQYRKNNVITIWKYHLITRNASLYYGKKKKTHQVISPNIYRD